MTYADHTVQELILATLKLNGNSKRKTYLSTTLIKNFFPNIQTLDEVTLERVLGTLSQKKILHYTKAQSNKNSTEYFYKIRIDNMPYINRRGGFPRIQAATKISSLRLVVNFPPGALNAELNIVVDDSGELTNYKVPIRIARAKSEAWNYFKHRQKAEIPLVDVIGKTYYKSGSEYVSRMLCGGKKRNGVKSERITQIFLHGYNLNNEPYVIANFSPTIQELLANQRLALEDEHDIHSLVADIAQFCE